jgi:hypothetical protein
MLSRERSTEIARRSKPAARMNMLPVGGAPDEVRRFIREETERWGEVIRSA